jgi:hypothetical protein
MTPLRSAKKHCFIRNLYISSSNVLDLYAKATKGEHELRKQLNERVIHIYIRKRDREGPKKHINTQTWQVS